MAAAKKDPEKPETEDPVVAEREARRQRAVALIREYLAGEEELDSKRRRMEFAARCNTTWPYLQLVIQGQRPVSVWLAVNLDRESKGALNMVELAVEFDPKHRIDWAYIHSAMRKRKSLE